MNEYKLLVADDHKVVREGLISLIEEENDYEVVAEAENGKDALEKIKEYDIDIAILDLDMPEMGGLEFLRKINGDYSELRVIVLSMIDKQEMIKNVIENGANGYVLKSSGAEHIVRALESVKEGGFYFCSDATDIIMKNLAGFDQRDTISISELTPREKEVLELICDELTNAEIAEKLNISVRTVDTHRSNLLQKTGAKNTAGLVKFALQSGIVSIAT